MANIPTYKPSESIKPAAVGHDNSGEHLARELDSIVNHVDAIRQQDVNFDINVKAKEAGSQLDFAPSEPLTRGDVRFQRRALQANQLAVNNNIRETALKFRSELTAPGKLTTNSGVKFRAQMLDYKAEVLGRIPEGNRQYAANKIDFYTESYGSMVDAKSNALAENNMKFSLYQFIDGSMQDASAQALQGGFGTVNAAALYGDIFRKVTAATASGLIPAQQAETILRMNQEKLQSFAVIGQFRQDLATGNGQESLQKFAAHPPADMDLQNYVTTLNEMKGMLGAFQNMQASEAAVKEQQINQMFNDVARNEMSPTDPIISNTIGEVAKSGGQPAVNSFIGRLNHASIIRSAKLSTRFIAPDAAIKAYNQILSKLNPSSEHYNEEVKYLNNAKAAVDANLKEFKQDTAKYAFEAPGVQEAIQRKRVTPDDMGLIANPEVVKTLLATQYALGAQDIQFTGTEPLVSVIPNDTAGLITDKINRENPEDQVQSLSQIANKFSDNAWIAFRDLKRAGLPSSSLNLLGAGQFNQGMMLNAINALKINKEQLQKFVPLKQQRQISDAVSSQMRDFMSTVLGGTQPSIEEASDLIHQTSTLASYLVAINQDTQASAVKKAMDFYINGTMQINNINGRGNIRYPNDISTEDLSNATAIIQRNVIKPDANYNLPVDKMSGLSEAAQKREFSLSIKNVGTWRTRPDNRGILLTDQFGSPVMVDDEPVEILFNDLRDPTSELRQKINDFKFKVEGNSFQNFANPTYTMR